MIFTFYCPKFAFQKEPNSDSSHRELQACIVKGGKRKARSLNST